jgi:hypothetical protein
MKSRLIPALVWLWVVFLACTAQGATTYTSPEGDWWTVISGGELGKSRLTIPDPGSGSGFQIFGFGYLYKTSSVFFEVPLQTLAFDAKGRITGILDLLDELGDPLGTITVTGGSFGVKYAHFELSGTLAMEGGPNKGKVVLKGSRMPDVSTVLTGETINGVATGKGIRSRHMTLSVVEDERVFDHDFDLDTPDEDLLFPFYSLSGGGPVKVKGVSGDVHVEYTGNFIVSPGSTDKKGTNAVGTVSLSMSMPEDVDEKGSMTGNLSVQNGKRNARFNIKTSRYSFEVAGKLNIANSPILSVTPTGGLPFPDTVEDKTNSMDFTVKNIGVGTLSGVVNITQENVNVFKILEVVIEGQAQADDSYTLEVGQEAIVTIEFAPPTADKDVTYSGTATFTGGGGATRTLTGTGTDVKTE